MCVDVTLVRYSSTIFLHPRVTGYTWPGPTLPHTIGSRVSDAKVHYTTMYERSTGEVVLTRTMTCRWKVRQVTLSQLHCCEYALGNNIYTEGTRQVYVT